MKLPATLMPSRTRLAFTLTELVVLVVVVGVLVCLLATNALRNSRSVKRAQCAGNLRELGLAMQILGNENDGRLPNQASGAWAWDLPYGTGTFVETAVSKWTVMYCPGTSPFFTENDNWNLYNFAPNLIRVIGYATTLPGTASVISSNINNTLLPERVQVSPGVFVTPSPAGRVLLADATISAVGQNNTALQFSAAYNYVNIPGGFVRPHLSPHLNGRFPAGGNLNLLDGHVEWRQFQNMSPRTTPTAPTFWW